MARRRTSRRRRARKNPLSGTEEVLVAVVALAAIGGLIYYVTKPAATGTTGSLAPGN